MLHVENESYWKYVDTHRMKINNIINTIIDICSPFFDLFEFVRFDSVRQWVNSCQKWPMFSGWNLMYIRLLCSLISNRNTHTQKKLQPNLLTQATHIYFEANAHLLILDRVIYITLCSQNGFAACFKLNI